MEQKVVKCSNDRCGQYFMQTKKDMQCPFCHTPYNAVEERPVEEKKKEKKGTAKNRKEPFKIWKN